MKLNKIKFWTWLCRDCGDIAVAANNSNVQMIPIFPSKVLAELQLSEERMEDVFYVSEIEVTVYEDFHPKGHS